MRDSDGEIFLQYSEDIGTKTNKGGLKHRKIEAKTVDLYATANADRCPLCAIMKYLSVLPKNRTCNAFYLQPRKKYFGRGDVSHCWLAWPLHQPFTPCYDGHKALSEQRR